MQIFAEFAKFFLFILQKNARLWDWTAVKIRLQIPQTRGKKKSKERKLRGKVLKI
jgi:hypothetical protein